METPQAPQAPQAQQYDYSSVPLAELEATRVKLLSLTRSLHKLQDDIARGTLPRWESLQNQYSVIITQLGSLSAEIFLSFDILSSRNVYPLPSFPTMQQEGLLNTLLRKKPSPEVSEWIEVAEKFVDKLGVDVNSLKYDEDDQRFIDWCLEILQTEQQNHNFFSVFTQEEIESGVKNEMFKIDKRSNEQKPQLGLDVDQVLKFMHTGSVS